MAERRGVGDYLDAVTRFVFVRDEPAAADVIFIPGSSRLAHVTLAAELYLRGLAPLILPSGAHPHKAAAFTGAEGFASEAEFMADHLVRLGVPRAAILTEDQATFTWENALFSRRLADARGLRFSTALLCCRPFHARRALTYYSCAFPDTVIRVIPAEEAGRNAGDWMDTPEGREKVLGEVRRLGSQVAGQIEDALREGKP